MSEIPASPKTGYATKIKHLHNKGRKHMPVIEIDKIIIPEDRGKRRAIGNVDDLAYSIKKYGLFHPVILDEKNVLVSGGRRLEACKLLKFEDIEFKLKDNLNEFEKREIELEENICRKQLEWQEEVKYKLELDILKRRIYGYADRFNPEGWSLEDTAQAIGEPAVVTKRDVLLAKALEVMPELEKCKNKSDALKMLRNEKGRMVREEFVRKAEKEFKSEKREELIKVIEGDCLEVMKNMSSESFDLCISDPPFGVGLDGMTFNSGYDKYEDKEEDMFKLYQASVIEVARLLKVNTHFYMFFPIKAHTIGWYYEELRKSFDYVDPIPLVWVKNKGGFTVDARFRYQPRYQPIFFCSKGRRALKMGAENGNVFSYPVPEGKKHPAEASVELLEEFIEQSSLPGELVLDPFAGSGTTGVAALRRKRRAVLIEKMRDYVTLIKSRVYKEGGERDE